MLQLEKSSAGKSIFWSFMSKKLVDERTFLWPFHPPFAFPKSGIFFAFKKNTDILKSSYSTLCIILLLNKNVISVGTITQIKLGGGVSPIHMTFYFHSMGDYPIKFYSAGGNIACYWGNCSISLGSEAGCLFVFVSQV